MMIQLLIAALQIASANPDSVTEYCNSEAGRITVMIYGSRAETYTLPNDGGAASGPHEWVYIDGAWRRTGLSPRYSSVAPTFRIEGDTMIYVYTINGVTREREWTVCE